MHLLPILHKDLNAGVRPQRGGRGRSAVWSSDSIAVVCHTPSMSDVAHARTQPAVIIGCCNLVTNDAGCYLLVQESKASAWYRFNLPAGKPEEGETLVDAAVREAQEETGLDVAVDHLVGIYQCPRTSEGFGVVNFVFFSQVVGGALRTSLAHPVVRYFSTKEIAEMVSARMIRGRHVPAAIADHESGRHLATSLIQIVPEMGRPRQAD
jgi:8-oxo-dGTP diphosphatase